MQRSRKRWRCLRTERWLSDVGVAVRTCPQGVPEAGFSPAHSCRRSSRTADSKWVCDADINGAGSSGKISLRVDGNTVFIAARSISKAHATSWRGSRNRSHMALGEGLGEVKVDVTELAFLNSSASRNS